MSAAMPRWLQIVLCLVLFGVAMAPAQNARASTLEEIRGVNQNIDWSAEFVPLVRRELLAAKFESYWKSFLDRLPRLTPSEKTYVDGERNSKSSERIIALMTKREYSIWFLLDRANFCQDIYAKLQIGSLSPNVEGYYWAKTQACYRNSSEVVSHLERASLSKNYNGSFNLAMFGVWEAFTIDVLVGSALLMPPEGAKP